MPSQTFETHSEEETIELGRRLAPQLGGVVLLIGNLGAGKTTFTKGIVEGLGLADSVSSPTFTLVHQYGDDVFHVDLYRLDTEAQVESLGLSELFNVGRIVLLEWAERFPRLLPQQRTEIRIETDDREDTRIVTVTTE